MQASPRALAPATAPSNASSSEAQHESADPPESCPACATSAARRRTKREQWVQCENHWVCVRTNPLDSLDAIDKWFCPTCLDASLTSPNPLAIILKAPSRKSARAAPKLDYANLDSHLPADPGKWLRSLDARKVTEGHFRRIDSASLTPEWLRSDEGMQEPFWVDSPEGLGMTMPPGDLTIAQVAEIVGPDETVEVIDVASQQSAPMTLANWAAYYADANRDKVKNVISLEFWPKELMKPDSYPRVQKYCLMSVANCWTDWHVDFAGSSVYYHILRGAKVFYFIRPTPANLAAYEEWSGNTERQESTWLGDTVDEVYKIELKTGNTMIIPTGWIHAVFTPSDTLVFGGNFLHSLDIERQLAVYQIELNTKVPRKFRFPHFVRLLWYVAQQYCADLRVAPALSPSSLPPSTNPRILAGLLRLSEFLVDQSGRLAKNATGTAERKRVAKDNVPPTVKDPTSLCRELRVLVLKALGREPDDLCAPPPQTSPTTTRKRKADSLEPAPAGHTPLKVKIHAGPSSTSSSSLSTAKRDVAEIISTKTIPVTVSETTELREDPLHLETGKRYAHVRESRSTQEVVRRSVGDDGFITIETRKVLTVVEQVRLPPLPRPSPPPSISSSSGLLQFENPFASARLPPPGSETTSTPERRGSTGGGSLHSYGNSSVTSAMPLPSFGPPFPSYPSGPFAPGEGENDILSAIGRSLPPQPAPLLRRASTVHSLLAGEEEAKEGKYEAFGEHEFEGGAAGDQPMA
ncbi:hypothetical protein RQP46_011502 [Phenoliferia psychrophenolica]